MCKTVKTLPTMHTRPFTFVFAVSCVTLRKVPFCVNSPPVKISEKIRCLSAKVHIAKIAFFVSHTLTTVTNFSDL